jgi:hypothetical protein
LRRFLPALGVVLCSIWASGSAQAGCVSPPFWTVGGIVDAMGYADAAFVGTVVEHRSADQGYDDRIYDTLILTVEEDEQGNLGNVVEVVIWEPGQMMEQFNPDYSEGQRVGMLLVLEKGRWLDYTPTCSAPPDPDMFLTAMGHVSPVADPVSGPPAPPLPPANIGLGLVSAAIVVSIILAGIAIGARVAARHSRATQRSRLE